MTATGPIGAPGAHMPPIPGGVRAATGKVLRFGVVVSASVVAAGLIVMAVRTPHLVTSAAAERARLAGRASFPHSFPALFDGLRRASGESIVVLGILALMATPPAGLVAALVAFLERRDRQFALFSLIVLAVIVVSAAVGVYAA